MKEDALNNTKNLSRDSSFGVPAKHSQERPKNDEEMWESFHWCDRHLSTTLFPRRSRPLRERGRMQI